MFLLYLYIIKVLSLLDQVILRSNNCHSCLSYFGSVLNYVAVSLSFSAVVHFFNVLCYCLLGCILNITYEFFPL